MNAWRAIAFAITRYAVYFPVPLFLLYIHLRDLGALAMAIGFVLIAITCEWVWQSRKDKQRSPGLSRKATFIFLLPGAAWMLCFLPVSSGAMEIAVLLFAWIIGSVGRQLWRGLSAFSVYGFLASVFVFFTSGAEPRLIVQDHAVWFVAQILLVGLVRPKTAWRLGPALPIVLASVQGMIPVDVVLWCAAALVFPGVAGVTLLRALVLLLVGVFGFFFVFGQYPPELFLMIFFAVDVLVFLFAESLLRLWQPRRSME